MEFVTAFLVLIFALLLWWIDKIDDNMTNRAKLFLRAWLVGVLVFGGGVLWLGAGASWTAVLIVLDVLFFLMFLNLIDFCTRYFDANNHGKAYLRKKANILEIRLLHLLGEI